MSESYSDQFEKFYTITRKVAHLWGVDIINLNYKYDWKTYFVLLLLNVGCGFTTYTILIDLFNKNWTSMLISLSIIGGGIQAYVKFGIVTSNAYTNLQRYMYKTISNIYIDYEKKSEDYRNELKLGLSRVKKVILILFYLVLAVSTIMIGAPLYMLIVQGRRTHMLNFFIPYIDLDTDFGYYFTFAVHGICVIFCLFGNLLSDTWFFIYVAHVPLISHILKCKFRDLDKLLEEHPNDAEKSKPLLIDILKWHQKYNEYSQILKETYYWIVFATVGSEFITIINAIVCIFLNLWPAAPAFLTLAFSMFYCFCAVGNIVEVANDDVIFYIYDSKWYLLTAKEQKMVLYMLRNAQQATGILIADVTPLSLSTALQMTKTFYTLSMLLREFLND